MVCCLNTYINTALLVEGPILTRHYMSMGGGDGMMKTKTEVDVDDSLPRHEFQKYQMWEVKRGLPVLYEARQRRRLTTTKGAASPTSPISVTTVSRTSSVPVVEPTSLHHDEGHGMVAPVKQELYHTLRCGGMRRPSKVSSSTSSLSSSDAVHIRVQAAAVTPVDLLYTLSLDVKAMQRQRKTRFVDRLVAAPTSLTIHEILPQGHADSQQEEEEGEEECLLQEAVNAEVGWQDGGAAETCFPSESSSGGGTRSRGRGFFSRLVFSRSSPPQAGHPIVSPGPPLLWESFRVELPPPPPKKDTNRKERPPPLFVGGTIGVGIIESLPGPGAITTAAGAAAAPPRDILSMEDEGRAGPHHTDEDQLCEGDRVLFYTSPALLPPPRDDDDDDELSSSSLVYRHGGCWSGYAVVKPECVIRLPSPSSASTNASLAPTPTDAEAAALPYAGWTAYVALFDKLRILKGETLLVVGGVSDAVGFVAAQLAAHFGAEVCTTSSEPWGPETLDRARLLRRRGVHVLGLGSLASCDGQGIDAGTEEGGPCATSPPPTMESYQGEVAFDHVLLCSTRPAALKPVEEIAQRNKAGIGAEAGDREDTQQQDTAPLTHPNSGHNSNTTTNTPSSPRGAEEKKSKARKALTPEAHQAQCRQAVVDRLRRFFCHCTKHGAGICSTMVPPPDALLAMLDQQSHEADEEEVVGVMIRGVANRSRASPSRGDHRNVMAPHSSPSSSAVITTTSWSSLFRRRELSIHFVLLHTLFLDPLTRPMLRDIGKRVWQLYLEGAFCLQLRHHHHHHPSTIPPSPEDDAVREWNEAAQNADAGRACASRCMTSTEAMDSPPPLMTDVSHGSVIQLFPADQLCAAILTEAKKQSLVFSDDSSEDVAKATVTSAKMEMKTAGPCALPSDDTRRVSWVPEPPPPLFVVLDVKTLSAST